MTVVDNCGDKSTLIVICSSEIKTRMTTSAKVKLNILVLLNKHKTLFTSLNKSCEKNISQNTVYYEYECSHFRLVNRDASLITLCLIVLVINLSKIKG